MVERAEALGLSAREVADFTALPGNGLSAALDGAQLCGGSLAYISGRAEVREETRAQADRLSAGGKTPLLFCRERTLLGMIAVADAIKPESAQAVRELQNMGISVVMLTGGQPAHRRGHRPRGGRGPGDRGRACPTARESVIRSLQSQGKVAMVGDGITTRRR